MPVTWGDYSEPWIWESELDAAAPDCSVPPNILSAGFVIEFLDWIDEDVVGFDAKFVVELLAPIWVNFCSNIRSFYIIYITVDVGTH